MAASGPPPRASARTSFAWRLRRWAVRLLVLAALGVGAATLWQSEWAQAPRTLWELVRMPPPTALPVPVEGVRARQVADTFGAPRGRDRRHEGVDIFASRGTPVRSATLGVVADIRESGLGGRQVWVLGPARERYYYAHLDGWREGLERGEVVQPGTVLGYVGDTGNAKGTPPHLHWGIYGADGAYDPLPLLRAWQAP
ncbi:M23 family metallopeptidase [Stenotrophomonas sp. C3(2023)]|uniref:M23 family metallopeptidase n=1 Tax=Stenotrophomonas sp. C3(2023) TaxID=3080277 RepID=UPI00293CBF1C|nr:M23 family metallopeptidase [Stenotrophomonas sp. C3(2023)]MDV3467508.1 M23 family metallopeptidase [Stenotrophomonas sp. C3(2023)]